MAVPLLFRDNHTTRQKLYFKITKKGEKERFTLEKKAPKQFEFLSLLYSESNPVSLNNLSHKIQSASQIYKKLLDKKLITIIPENEICNTDLLNIRNITLNNEQSVRRLER